MKNESRLKNKLCFPLKDKKKEILMKIEKKLFLKNFLKRRELD